VGRRSRKRRPGDEAGAASTPATADKAPRPAQAAAPTPDRAARTEAKNAALRESLEPLAPGERPAAVTVAAIIAALLGLSNLVLLATGYEVRGKDGGGPVGVMLFAVIMAAAAVGLWRARYWAVLGFQALLAITVLIAALSLGVASNALAVVLCLVIVLAGGTLFYKLIRAMARIQMPARPGRS